MSHSFGLFVALFNTLAQYQLKGFPVSQPFHAEPPNDLIGYHISAQYNLAHATHSAVFIHGSMYVLPIHFANTSL